MPKSIREVLEKLRDSEISCMTDKRGEAREQRIISALKDLSSIVLAMPRTPYDTEALQKVREATIEEISNLILGGEHE